MNIDKRGKSKEELIEQYIKESVKFLPDQEKVRQYARFLDLNPYLNDFFYQPRFDKKNNCYSKGSIVVSFDIYLAKAWETKEFLGVDTEEIYEKNQLICVKAIGKRNVNGNTATLSFNAYLKEYQPANVSNFSPWHNMPTVMLRKCAIANVVRQLFADTLKLPYIPEEMEQAQDVQNVVEKKHVNDDISKEKKLQKSMDWVVEFYKIITEKGEEFLNSDQKNLIFKASDKNLPNSKNLSIKDTILELSAFYSKAAGINNPLDSHISGLEEFPEYMFNEESEVNFEDSKFPYTKREVIQ